MSSQNIVSDVLYYWNNIDTVWAGIQGVALHEGIRIDGGGYGRHILGADVLS
jgi:hypothetical protein